MVGSSICEFGGFIALRRRHLIISGILSAATLTKWHKPVVSSIFLPAHASTSPIPCTPVILPSISISVLDQTNQQMLNCGASASITSGGFSAKISPSGTNCALWLLQERVGIYDVTVTHPGYLDWSQSGVEVKQAADGCHVITVPLTALMVKL